MNTLNGVELAAVITRNASQQTYYTIRYLVDKPLVGDAFRTYAYFRWVDDWLDDQPISRAERLAFIQRQRDLLERCQDGVVLPSLCPEERLLVELTRGPLGEDLGLRAYLQNMMSVMTFDTERRGLLVPRAELDHYTHCLAVAVTEAMHTFIGRGRIAPMGELRYQAVTGAHIAHMLRDAVDDARMGYYNLPLEVIQASGIAPWDVTSPPYREWVAMRVAEAKACFDAGRKQLAGVKCLRCRIAGYAYIHRFEVVLHSIEREGYLLREAYPERKSPGVYVEMLSQALWMGLTGYRQTPFSRSGLAGKGTR